MVLNRILLTATAVAVALTAARPLAAGHDQIQPPSVPGNLMVTGPFKPFLIGAATGSQNYVCLPSATGFAWTLYTPQATLFNDEGQQIITHFLSANPDEPGVARPTWQSSRDTSSVWAMVIQSSPDANYVAPGAIPWLLLQTAGTQYGPDNGDKLTVTKYIQRINTSGGVAPATGCALLTDVGKKALVPYTADYVFYKERGHE